MKKKNYSLKNYFNSYSKELNNTFKNIDHNQLLKIQNIIEQKYQKKRNVFICGNGGSSSISNHWECDHREGIKRSNKFKPKAISLVSNTDIITAIANDNGYEKIFSNSFDNLHEKDDLLICFSVSGNSKNIINVMKLAKKRKIEIVFFGGFNGGAAKNYSDYKIIFRSKNFGIVEDCFQMIMHVLAQYIEKK
jgi:D-sedoheptulose 7-phosphate isomerase